MSKDVHCPSCGTVFEPEDENDHSDPMRRRFFAIVRDVWANLPDDLRERFPSVEVLRKTALCRAGWAECMVATCGTKAATTEMVRVAKSLDRYAIVDVAGTVVTIFTARSLKKRHCPKKTFLQVSEKTLDWLSQLIGTDVSQSHEGRNAA